MKLKNTRKVQLTVELKDGRKATFNPGEAHDVDGRQNWAEHCFVKAGWLVEVEEPRAARKAKKEDTEQAE
ncbi:MAG: hypothetical protein R3268_05910 [Acidiferrobacterales bacterium]|nr:hypothetical protein [Acidiferrobacterales bacterium]